MKKIASFYIVVSIIIEIFSKNISCASVDNKEIQEYVVAVIDTGVDYNHEDLKNNMWQNNTTLDGIHGYDFMNDDDDPYDDLGHGTHCASLILSEAEKYGLKQKVKIMALKYMDESGGGMFKNAIDAYRYVIAAKKQGVNIVAISNSWGGTDNPVELENIIIEAGKMGILSISSAGNTAQNLDVEKSFPAGYQLPYNIVVSASTEENMLATFSNYGKLTSHVATLGTNRIAAYNQDAYIPSFANSNYKYFDFENKELPNWGNNIRISEEEAFEDKNSLRWDIKITPTDEFYIEKLEESSYTNMLTIDLEKKVDNTYFGMSYKVKSKPDNLMACYVLMYDNDIWTTAGSFMLENINFWNNRYFKLKDGVTKIQIICTGVLDEASMYIDNLGIGETSGKYIRLNGTPQAVTSVVAETLYLRELFPDEPIEKIRARVIGGVNKNFKNIVVSDGVIDINKAKTNPYPVIDYIRRKDGKIEISGFFFGNSSGSITIASNMTEINSWSENKIIIMDKHYEDGFININIKTKNGLESEQKMIIISENVNWLEKAPLPIGLKDAVSVELGGMIYVMGGADYEDKPSLGVYRYDPSKDKWKTMSSLPSQEFNGCYSYGMSVATFDDSILLVVMDNMHDKNIFLNYSVENNSWSEMLFDDTPEPRAFMTISSYNDTIYFIGGIPKAKYYGRNDLAVNIWSLSEDRSTWNVSGKLGTPIYGAIAAQVEDKLVILGGRIGDIDYSDKVYIFDGLNIYDGSKLPIIGLHNENCVFSGGEKMYILTEGDIVDINGLSYDVDKDEWMQYSDRVCCGIRRGIFGTLLDNEFYVMGGELDYRILDKVNVINISDLSEKKSRTVSILIIIVSSILLIILIIYIIKIKKRFK
ncbi:S8 family serine peptidase [Sedimentibacter sp. zth1]|uniref:S8 family serine peptidase n=1 Tax=Sedimentibacter sp. zth1 TaxID=2816908 RepID=UPI001A92BC78|nr:S8 family serine peptidase [Sedimentibacter sp. zth1]QSX05854.1 S8 family serine peptidase [Sedimentibacter sp. zth1]